MTQGASPAKVRKHDDVWREQLTPMQYKITRKQGTEPAFTGPFWDEKAPGLYSCICCAAPLFDAAAKYDSGTGWPSFFQPVAATAVEEHADGWLLLRRVEVRCARCDAHLGHVFRDGPRPTGRRYCMNGHALAFDPRANRAERVS